MWYNDKNDKTAKAVFSVGIILSFLLCSLAAGLLPVLLGGLPWWAGVLLFVLCYALCHPLYVLMVYLPCRKVDKEKPIAQQQPFARYCTARMARVLCHYAGIRPHITGLEKLPKEGRFLFVCNHRSLYDPLMVMGYLGDYNIAFISKPSNLALPLVGKIAYAVGFLPIDRENDRAALKTILTAADYMKRGVCSIGVYPEGTRSKTGEMLPFHAGSFKAAQRAGVPVAVACVQGTEKLKKRLLLGTDVYLDILDVIPAEQVKAMKTTELSEHCRQLIEAKLEE